MWITAAVLRARDAPYRIEDVQLRDPGPDEVRVRVVAVGMCHTDVLPRMSGFLASPPIITGHEASGVIAAVGETVTNLIAGDHVVISFDACRACSNCQAGASGVLRVVCHPQPHRSRRRGQRHCSRRRRHAHRVALVRSVVICQPCDRRGPQRCQGGSDDSAGVARSARVRRADRGRVDSGRPGR